MSENLSLFSLEENAQKNLFDEQSTDAGQIDVV